MADTVVGTRDQLIEACDRLAREPLALTEFDFKIFASTHPELVIEGRRKQAKARATANEAAFVAHQKALCEKAAQPATTAPVRLTPFRDGDNFDEWLTANAWAPAPIWMIQDLREFAKQTSEKNRERNAKIEALEARCAALENRPSGGDTGALEARVKSLEERPSMVYRGVWDDDTAYHAGDFVTLSGSVWVCKGKRIKSRPGTDANWQLAVKRGADGRDGKDLR